VHWEFQRKAAQESVNYLSGVKGVCNNITLKPDTGANAIKDLVEKALQRDAEINAANIRVSADAGDVTLSGSINSWGERREACSTAWSAPGVTSVENNLIVTY
jgi:osmotically-inducible protein OsmY